jgi:hypothetical protein
MADAPGNPLTGWHLDKKVPLALIFALVMQTAAFAMWVGSINSRVDALENRQVALEDLRDRMIRVEVLLEALVERVDREATNGH